MNINNIINSEILVYIIIGNADEMLWLYEKPELGLFKIKNFVSKKDQFVLVYGTGEIVGKHFGQTPSKYALGFLSKSSISEISESCDLKRGGGILQRRSFTLSLDNTRELKNHLDSLGVGLYGRQVYVIEYGYDASQIETRTLTFNPLSFGIVTCLQWGDTDLKLSVLPSFEMIRRSNVMIEDFPITIGDLDYGVNRIDREASLLFADLEVSDVIDIRTTSTEPPLYAYIFSRQLNDNEKINNEDILANIDSLRDSERNCYCIANKSVEAIKIFGIDNEWLDPNTGNYVLRMLLYEKFDGDFNPLTIDVYEYDFSYISDKWPNSLGRKLDLDGLTAEMDRPFFVNKHNKIQDISAIGGMVNSSEWNEIQPNSILTYLLKRRFNPHDWVINGLYNIYSYDYKMSNSFKLIDNSDRLKWWSDNGDISGVKIDTGLFSPSGQMLNAVYYAKPELDGGKIINGDIEEFEEVGVSLSATGNSSDWFRLMFAAVFDIENNENIDFDNEYLSARFSTDNIVNGAPPGTGAGGRSVVSRVLLRHSQGGVISDILDVVGDEGEFGFDTFQSGVINHFKLRNMLIKIPESYYGSDDRGVANVFFSKGKAQRSFGNMDLISGLSIGHISTPISVDRNNLKRNILLVVETKSSRSGTGSGSFTASRVFGIRINELGILYKKAVDISEYILMKTKGRMFRITPPEGTAVPEHYFTIDNPVTAIEHFRKLSNWEETREGTYDRNKIWGEAYVTEGYSDRIDAKSFNNPSINALKEIKIAGQILDSEDAESDSIVKSICQDFYIVANQIIPHSSLPWPGQMVFEWIDTTSIANEGIANIDIPIDPNNLPAIKHDQLISFGDVVEPSSSDICLEPIIKYGYVHGIGFTKELSIHGIATHSTYQDGLAVGFEGSDGMRIWRRCNDLFKICRNFAQMPQNIIEQKWIQSYATAKWKLEKFLEWQLRPRIQIVVSWNVGYRWRVGTHIKMSIPHIKSGDPLLCVCESVGKNYQHGKVTAGLIYLESVNPEPETFVIIDESGDRNIVIDESGDNQITNIEGVV